MTNKIFASLILIIGLIVSLIFLFFGLNLLSKNPGLFGLIWVFIALVAFIWKGKKIFK